MKKTAVCFAVLCFAFILFTACSGKPEESAGAAENDKPLFNKKDGYILNFSEEFDKSRNAVDDFGVSFVIAVDVSGSMSDSTKTNARARFIQAANSLKSIAEFIKQLKKSNPDILIKVGVLKFSSKVETVMPFTEMNNEGIERFISLAVPRNFNPEGSTAIGKAMESSSEILAQSGTILNSIIVITDGENNVKPEPEDVINAIYLNRNTISTGSFKVSTSTQLINLISFDIDSSLFSKYKQLGVKVLSANDQKELEETLKDLLVADISKLE